MAKCAGGCQPAPWSLCARHTARPTYGHPMESTESESKDRLFVTALARGLAVLAAFRGGEPQLSDQDPASRRYQLGLAVLELSAATLASFDARRVIAPKMQQFAEAHGVSVSLAVR